jgi:hypothetical protein
VAATAPDWGYVSDDTTREWLQTLPVETQQELHGQSPDHLQHEHGDRMAAEVFALGRRSTDMPADFSDWDDDRKIDWFNAKAARLRSERQAAAQEAG